MRHRFLTVDGLKLFYREAGSKHAPTVLLMHGFPSSSFQFRELIPALSHHWRVVAPDMPGFGFSSVPSSGTYSFTFERLAHTISQFLDTLSLQPWAVYLHDYGAQVGFRLLTKSILRPHALVIQNSEAHYADGRTRAWTHAEEFWHDPSEANRDRLRNAILSEEGIRREFLESLPLDLAEQIDPAVVQLAWERIRRPEAVEAMLDLHRDYPSNVAHYPTIQSWLREQQPATLVLWGRHDQYYTPEAANAFRRDLPNSHIEILEGGGHWVLESDSPTVCHLTRDFLERSAK